MKIFNFPTINTILKYIKSRFKKDFKKKIAIFFSTGLILGFGYTIVKFNFKISSLIVNLKSLDFNLKSFSLYTYFYPVIDKSPLTFIKKKFSWYKGVGDIIANLDTKTIIAFISIQALVLSYELKLVSERTMNWGKALHLQYGEGCFECDTSKVAVQPDGTIKTITNPDTDSSASLEKPLRIGDKRNRKRRDSTSSSDFGVYKP